MLISDKFNFIFIHVPKNSGTEMTNQIKKKYPKCKILMNVERKGKNTGIDKMHLYNSVINRFIKNDILEKYIKFCIIRNPYNKLYSAWNFIKERHGYKDVNDFIKYKLDKKFIYGLEIIPGDARVHYRPQYTFVYDENNNKCVDFIIKYENLNNDIKKLNNKFNLNIPEYGNTNTNKNYLKFFNKESIKKINKLYKKDFILFNYDMVKVNDEPKKNILYDNTKVLKIYYHNFWPDFNPPNENLHKLIKYTFNTNGLINNQRIKITLYTNIIDYLNDYKNSNGDFNKITIDPPDIVLSSVFGNIHSNRIFPSSTFKLFYSGENLKIRKDYSNYKLLDKYFDVILGFDKSKSKLYPNPEKVIRLPLWILYYDNLFKEIPIINTNNENQEYKIEIQDLTKIILNNRQKYLDNNADTSIKKRFRNNTKASFIARKTFLTQNPKNIKNIIYNTIKQVIYTENKKPIDISCPSSLFNNTQPIGNTIEDKIKHISQFMFNICPENSYSDGYTTEKIFHAYDSGCIPIYWGNNPVEKKIINPSSYIYYDPINPLVALNKIDRLIKNENEYKKFIDNNLNPVFLDNANNEIKDIIEYSKQQINKLYFKNS